MDSETLNSFRQQLFDWTEQRLSSGRYPFRRVEQELELCAPSGQSVADLVLWINRESFLAGGIILLPTEATPHWQQKGLEIAQVLGLSHFILWEPQAVTIWETQQLGAPLHTIDLNLSGTIDARDFEQALDQVLVKLKLLSVSGAISHDDLTAYYFANLCRLTLENVLPGQTETIRMSAGESRSDTWTDRLPRHKTWLTLWRLLYLLSRDALPTSLQPHRLEDAMRYALHETEPPAGFLLGTDEPPLNEESAVGFYHLAKRMQQLHWQQAPERSAETVNLLLKTAASQFGILQGDLPWPTNNLDLAVNYLPGDKTRIASLVAPVAFQTGHTLLSLLNQTAPVALPGESVDAVPISFPSETIVAHLVDDLAQPANLRQRRLVKLREVWPNHRFNIPANTPTWVWEGLYLAGRTAPDGELSLALPKHWWSAPGSNLLWKYLLKRFQLVQCAELQKRTLLFGFAPHNRKTKLTIARKGNPVVLPAKFAQDHTPGQLNLCLHAHDDVLRLWADGSLRFQPPENRNAPPRTRETLLFLHTSLGRHIWQCQSIAALPRSPEELSGIINDVPLLLPSNDVLGAFALLDWQPGSHLPSLERLDRVLHSCWGKLPAIPAEMSHDRPTAKRQQGQRQLREQIMEKVFRDGIPRFPDDYLRNYCRPKLQKYGFPGPLTMHDRFFGHIYLRASDGSDIELTNEPTATALLLVSQGPQTEVLLPVDPELTADMLRRYFTDLNSRWTALVQECRKHIGNRRRALAMARDLWKATKLPSPESFQTLQS